MASSVRPLRSRFLAPSPSSPPDFSCFTSGSSVLGFLLVSFHPSQFRSRSRSTGACLSLRTVSSSSPSAYPLRLCFLSSASSPVLTTQPLPFPFPSTPFSLARVSRVPTYPLLPRLFPCASFHFGTQLSCIFLSPLTVSQHRCYFGCRPPVSSTAVLLSFRLRFWLLSLGDTP